MKEGILNFEHKETESAPWFSLLDIIKIDGKWAQIEGPLLKRGERGRQLVHYLYDDSWSHIDFNEYKLVNHLDSYVDHMLKEGQITNSEFERIKWDGDNIGTKLSLLVNVFGEFTKNEKILPNTE